MCSIIEHKMGNKCVDGCRRRKKKRKNISILKLVHSSAMQRSADRFVMSGCSDLFWSVTESIWLIWFSLMSSEFPWSPLILFQDGCSLDLLPASCRRLPPLCSPAATSLISPAVSRSPLDINETLIWCPMNLFSAPDYIFYVYLFIFLPVCVLLSLSIPPLCDLYKIWTF